jgi:hypothetical protein
MDNQWWDDELIEEPAESKHLENRDRDSDVQIKHLDLARRRKFRAQYE